MLLSPLPSFPPSSGTISLSRYRKESLGSRYLTEVILLKTLLSQLKLYMPRPTSVTMIIVNTIYNKYMLLRALDSDWIFQNLLHNSAYFVFTAFVILCTWRQWYSNVLICTVLFTCRIFLPMNDVSDYCKFPVLNRFWSCSIKLLTHFFQH